VRTLREANGWSLALQPFSHKVQRMFRGAKWATQNELRVPLRTSSPPAKLELRSPYEGRIQAYITSQDGEVYTAQILIH
jgi:hypothetical protein